MQRGLRESSSVASSLFAFSLSVSCLEETAGVGQSLKLGREAKKVVLEIKSCQEEVREMLPVVEEGKERGRNAVACSSERRVSTRRRQRPEGKSMRKAASAKVPQEGPSSFTRALDMMHKKSRVGIASDGQRAAHDWGRQTNWSEAAY